MRRLDLWVLGVLQVLVLGLPLFLGGRQSVGVALGCGLVLALLAITIRERWRREERPAVPGSLALAAFVAFVLATTVPLPPWLIERLSPATYRLYSEVLAGWPGEGGWSVWRPIALSAYDVFDALSRISIGLGAFLVIVAFPWRLADWAEDEPRIVVLDRLIMTLIVGGIAMAILGLAQQLLGNGWVMWISEEPANESRLSGPFVNPNHFAAWLEMLIPLTFAYGLTLLRRLRGRITATAMSSRGMGVRSRRVWVTALVAHQQRLWPPIVVAVGLLVMLAAHSGTDSRGGKVAVLVGLAVAAGGVTRRLGEKTATEGFKRWIPLLLTLTMLLGAALVFAGWWRADAQVAEEGIEGSLDFSLAARIAAYRLGSGIVRDFPWFGTGLGSWMDAFRPYQAPPIESGILDHAHNDYLELLAETGIVGVGLVLAFIASMLATIRSERKQAHAEQALADHGHHHHRAVDSGPAGFEMPEWRSAIRQHHLIRWGLAGGVTAILVHSLVEFGLRMPGNLLLLMVIVAMMVLSAGRRPAGRAPAVFALFLGFLLAAAPQIANWGLLELDRDPISPHDRVDRAEFLFSEEPEEGWERVVRLSRGAVDRAPADIEAHEMLAEALGSDEEAHLFLRNAVALQPWAVERRDTLGRRLVEDGDAVGGAAELAEAMYRYPSLSYHGYLMVRQGHERATKLNLKETLRLLGQPNNVGERLAALDSSTADAVERGLMRALEGGYPGALRSRANVVEQLANLLETRQRWDEAGDILFEEGQRSQNLDYLTRASRDHLVGKNYAGAEKCLLAALTLAPDQAQIYQSLATEVYAPRGQFEMADAVLDTGRRNAADLMPLYRSMSELLNLRKANERAVVLPANPSLDSESQAGPQASDSRRSQAPAEIGHP